MVPGNPCRLTIDPNTPIAQHIGGWIAVAADAVPDGYVLKHPFWIKNADEIGRPFPTSRTPIAIVVDVHIGTTDADNATSSGATTVRSGVRRHQGDHAPASKARPEDAVVPSRREVVTKVRHLDDDLIAKRIAVGPEEK
jgi:hypothetical protein